MTIELLDGTQLNCYPSEDPKVPHSTALTMDTTGLYLTTGRPAQSENRQSPLEMALPFLKHVSLFLAHQEEILKDSRLFLTPVPIQNGLAYTGTSGLQNPTLGVYIEWWKQFPQESHDRDGNPVWFISGSPLSGCHACSSVKTDGESSHGCQLQKSFGSTWRSFMEVNNRYAEAKAFCQAYTLEQAIQYFLNKRS